MVDLRMRIAKLPSHNGPGKLDSPDFPRTPIVCYMIARESQNFRSEDPPIPPTDGFEKS